MLILCQEIIEVLEVSILETADQGAFVPCESVRVVFFVTCACLIQLSLHTESLIVRVFERAKLLKVLVCEAFDLDVGGSEPA